MSVTHRIDSIEARLQCYRDQMVTLSEALGALRSLADTIVSELAADAATVRDLATIEQHALPAMDSAAIAEVGADSQTGIVCEVADVASTLTSTTTSDAPAPNGAEIAALEPITVDDVAASPEAAAQVPATRSDVAIEADTVTATMAAATAETPAASDTANVIDLAASRSKKAKSTQPARSRLAVGIAASLLLVASASVAVQSVINTDIGQRLLDLGACDADVLSEVAPLVRTDFPLR